MTLTKHELTEAQSARKAELERTIRIDLKAFARCGSALTEIRDERLYLDEYDTFEEYCEGRWGISARRGYQLIDGAEVAKRCEQVVQIPNEATARELGKLEPKEQLKAAREMKKSGVPVNSASARKAVSKVKSRGGLASTLDDVIDVDPVSESDSPKMSTQAKAAAQRIILEWWGRERNRLNEYPPATPGRVVELITRLFQ